MSLGRRENRLDDAAIHNRPEDGLTTVHCASPLAFGFKVRIWLNWISTLTTVYFQHKIIRQLVGDDSGNGPRQVF